MVKYMTYPYIIEIIDDYQNTEVDNSSRQLQKLHEKIIGDIGGFSRIRKPAFFQTSLHTAGADWYLT
jgi:hypothetical protein